MAFGGKAYEARVGQHVLSNLADYTRWGFDLRTPAPDYASALNPHGRDDALWPLLALLTLGLLGALRNRIALVGLAWWVLGLAPVLLLVSQRSQAYMYAPMIGLCLGAGAIVDAAKRLLEPQPLGEPRQAAPWVHRANRQMTVGFFVGLVLLGSYAVRNEQLLIRRQAERLADVDLPADAFVRKIELIRRVHAALTSGLSPDCKSVVIVTPRIEGTTEFYSSLLTRVFEGGKSLRALFPRLGSAEFVNEWTPQFRSATVVVGSVDGRLVVFGAGPTAHARMVTALRSAGFEREAMAHLAAARLAFPADTTLLALDR
jgi:hypothetical protein